MTRQSINKFIENIRPSEILMPLGWFDAAVLVLEPTLNERDDAFWYRGVRFVLDHDADWNYFREMT
jgi:hypothetical protein